MATYSIRRFSYSETPVKSSSYINSQVIQDATESYIINPIDNVVSYVESSKIGKMEPVKRKTGMIKRVTTPVKKYISYKRKKKK